MDNNLFCIILSKMPIFELYHFFLSKERYEQDTRFRVLNMRCNMQSKNLYKSEVYALSWT